MSTTIVTQEATAYHYEPLTVSRMCRDEIAALRMELERTEKLSRFDAEREAIHLLHELEDYRDAWDVMAFKAGNPAGMPF